jgi:hypothetical protein
MRPAREIAMSASVLFAVLAAAPSAAAAPGNDEGAVARARTEHGGEPGEHTGEAPEPTPEGNETSFLWRFGVSYGIHPGEPFVLIPSVDLDLVREHEEWVEAWVFGVRF